MPKREIGPSHYGPNGYMPSLKNGAGRPTESMLEQDFLVLLEFDPEVSRYGVQPIQIKWTPTGETARRYTPDVLVTYHPVAPDWRPKHPPTIYEVKPHEILKRDWKILRPKFKAIMKWARSNGFRFKLITDKQIRGTYLKNARFLLRFRSRYRTRNYELDIHRHVILRDALHKIGSSTPAKLLEHVTRVPVQQRELIPTLWLLIIQEVILVDLHLPLTMNSMIWINKEKLP